jgi:hypothetical protein
MQPDGYTHNSRDRQAVISTQLLVQSIIIAQLDQVGAALNVQKCK